MDNFICWFGGVLTGALVIIILSGIFYDDVLNTGSEAIKSIEECQKDLRRDEYCTIIAVPTDEVEED